MMAPLPTTAHVHMTAKKTLYLANPYGFSAQQRGGPLHELVRALESMGADVWEPFARNNQIDRASAGWAYQIGQADLRDVRAADGLFAVVNGCPPDEGVMVELGLAIAWEKPVFLFRDDFRRCTDSEVYPLNLMVFTGLPADGWEAAWYGSIEEIADPGKALARWLRHDRPPGASSAEADPIEEYESAHCRAAVGWALRLAAFTKARPGRAPAEQGEPDEAAGRRHRARRSVGARDGRPRVHDRTDCVCHEPERLTPTWTHPMIAGRDALSRYLKRTAALALLLAITPAAAAAQQGRLATGNWTRGLVGGWGHSWTPGYGKTKSDVQFVALHPPARPIRHQPPGAVRRRHAVPLRPTGDCRRRRRGRDLAGATTSGTTVGGRRTSSRSAD